MVALRLNLNLNILTDFFPRFTQILYDQKYRADIEEIRVEGHTSKYWSKTTTVDQHIS